jgi:hypothetical protein
MRETSDQLFDLLGVVRQVRGTVRAIICLGDEDADTSPEPDDVLALLELLGEKLVEIEQGVDDACTALSDRATAKRGCRQANAAPRPRKQALTVVPNTVDNTQAKSLNSVETSAS